MIELNLNPKNSELRIFSLLLIPFAFLLGYLIEHYLHAVSIAWSLVIILAGLGLGGVIHPKLVRWFYVSWMILAFPVGWLLSHAVLSFIFFGMFVPVGWIARFVGYDPLLVKPVTKDSYWQPLEHLDGSEQYFRQF